MPEDREKPAFWEKLVDVIMHKTVDNFVDSLAHYSKKFVRTAAMIIAGIAIATLGVALIAVGAAKWFAQFLPPWLAWIIVGILLILVGAVLVAANK